MTKTTLKIDNVYSQLITDDEHVKEILWGAMRYRELNYFHNARYRMKLWDGFVDFFKKETGRFLTGLLPEVRLALKQMKVEYSVIDKRDSVKFTQEKIDDQWLNKHLQPGMKPVELRDYQVDYINQSIRNSRGIIFAPTSCHAPGQGILMFDGSIKKVEDIKVGDFVMGDDSTQRTVEEIHSGKTMMYKIIPQKGDPFVVTGDHLLTLEATRQRKDVKVVDYLGWSETQKQVWKLIRTGVEFYQEKELTIPPYVLGLILGGGSILSIPGLTNEDEILVNTWKEYGKTLGLNFRKHDRNGERCPTYYLTKKNGDNPLSEKLKKMGLWKCNSGTKFIPAEYLTSSRQNRLSLLAGLVDADGRKSDVAGFEYCTKSNKLACNVLYLSKSLGFHATLNETCKCDQNGNRGLYYRVCISSPDLVDVPCNLERKKITCIKSRTNPLRVGFSVELVGEGDYYGFSLKEDPHYLMEDFTVTHNSGKTNVLIGTLLLLPPNTPTLVLANRKSLVDQNYDEICMWGIKDVGRFYGNHKEVKNITCATVQSSHLLKNHLPKIKCIFVDEVHEMMSKKPRSVYAACKNASVRIGMSATPFKFGEKDKVQKYEAKGYIGPVFVATNTETGRLSTKDLQARGILASADCTFYPVHEPKLPYHVYIDAVTDGIAHNLVLHEMTRRLVDSLEGRILIIVERITHGDLLHDAIPNSVWVRGQDTLETRKAIIKRLKEDKGKIVAIATSGIFDAGINVFVNSLVNCAGGQADHKIIQRFGRGLRVADDKKHLQYYDWYFTNNDYLEKHSEKRIQILEKEGHNITVKEKFDL